MCTMSGGCAVSNASVGSGGMGLSGTCASLGADMVFWVSLADDRVAWAGACS